MKIKRPFRSHRPRGFGIAFLSVVLAAAIIFWPQGAKGQHQAVPKQHQAVPKLTLAQVEQLVTSKVPDSTLGTQIQRRGLTFVSNSALIESLRAKGAGPLTLAAIEASITKASSGSGKYEGTQVSQGSGKRRLRAAPGVGSLEVHTEPGCQLFLDGKEVGSAGYVGLGHFRLEGVPEGNHELTAQKTGFQDAHASFSLANMEDKQLSLPMGWLGGFLSVSAQPADAQIHVTGPWSFDGSGEDVRSQPGSYTVTFSEDGYQKQTRTFQIAAGEHHVERAQLTVDPAFVASHLAAAKAKLDAGDPAGAIQDARRVLKVNHADVNAEVILAEASFQTGDMDTFAYSGATAVSNGGNVAVMLMHVHNYPHRMIHGVTLTISASGLSIAVPPGNSCKISPAILFSQITQVGVKRDQAGALELHIAALTKPHEKARFLGSVHDLDFVAEGSAVVNQPGTLVVFNGEDTPIQSPGNAAGVLQAVANLILRVKG
jgi:hypothetical protein